MLIAEKKQQLVGIKLMGFSPWLCRGKGGVPKNEFATVHVQG